MILINFGDLILFTLSTQIEFKFRIKYNFPDSLAMHRYAAGNALSCPIYYYLKSLKSFVKKKRSLKSIVKKRSSKSHPKKKKSRKSSIDLDKN